MIWGVYGTGSSGSWGTLQILIHSGVRSATRLMCLIFRSDVYVVYNTLPSHFTLHTHFSSLWGLRFEVRFGVRSLRLRLLGWGWGERVEVGESVHQEKKEIERVTSSHAGGGGWHCDCHTTVAVWSLLCDLITTPPCHTTTTFTPVRPHTHKQETTQHIAQYEIRTCLCVCAAVCERPRQAESPFVCRQVCHV